MSKLKSLLKTYLFQADPKCPCLRPARRDFAQAGEILCRERFQTVPYNVRGWAFFNSLSNI